MRKLREWESALIRAESAVAVVLVLLMLMLAAYNVVYRNVLVPLQNHWAHSGPPVEPTTEPPADVAPTKVDPGPTKAEPTKDGGGDFGGFGGGLGEEPEDGAGDEGADGFGGFGGGLGEEPEEPEETEKPKPEPEPKSDGGGADDFGGFGGDAEDGDDDDAAKESEPVGDDGEAAAPDPESGAGDFGGFGGDDGDDGDDDEAGKPAAGGGGDGFGGFGGGLGDDAEDDPDADGGAEGFGGGLSAKDADDGDDDLEEDDFGDDDFGDEGDPFANLPDIDAVGQKTAIDDGPKGGPPPEGSFAAWGIDFIDTIKLDWIDIFLRQLVIIVSFLGAMLATQRRKHINIDALSKVLPAGARRLVGILMPLFALGICLVLASAGWDLVQISREFPKELLPFAQEWHMQLMFPVGFGLMALHFGVRVLEAIAPPEEPEREEVRPSDIVTRVDDDDDDVGEAEALAKAATADERSFDGDDSRPESKSGLILADTEGEPDEEDEDDPPDDAEADSDDEGGQD